MIDIDVEIIESTSCGIKYYVASAKGMESSRERWNDPQGALLEFIKANEEKLGIRVNVESPYA